MVSCGISITPTYTQTEICFESFAFTLESSNHATSVCHLSQVPYIAICVDEIFCLLTVSPNRFRNCSEKIQMFQF